MATKTKQDSLVELPKIRYFTLPRGTVKFSSLDKPDDRFSKTRPKFNITVCYKPEDLADFEKKLTALNKAWKTEVMNAIAPNDTDGTKFKRFAKKNEGFRFKGIPIHDDEDKDGNDTGLKQLRAAVDAFSISTDPQDPEKERRILRPVPMFDAAAEPVSGVRCYGGSIVRLTVGVKHYAGASIGAGLSLLLSAIQVIKASGGARSAAGYGFSNEELDAEEAADAEASDDVAESDDASDESVEDTDTEADTEAGADDDDI